MIDYYEVALGTEWHEPKTRENVVEFTDVGLSKVWTFENVTLVPRKQTYYVTVRAHSKSSAVSVVASNGIRVGYKGQLLIQGELDVPRYVFARLSIYLFTGIYKTHFP